MLKLLHSYEGVSAMQFKIFSIVLGVNLGLLKIILILLALINNQKTKKAPIWEPFTEYESMILFSENAHRPERYSYPEYFHRYDLGAECPKHLRAQLNLYNLYCSLLLPLNHRCNYPNDKLM